MYTHFVLLLSSSFLLFRLSFLSEDSDFLFLASWEEVAILTQPQRARRAKLRSWQVIKYAAALLLCHV